MARIDNSSSVNPRPLLDSLVGKNVIIRLKWGNDYKGFLISVNEEMNLALINTEEFINGQSKGKLGAVLVRSNNIIDISGTDDEEYDNVEER